MGLAFVFLLALQTDPIELAARKGVENIKARVLASDEGHDDALWTLVQARVPDTDPVVVRLLKELLTRPLDTTRGVALQALILQEIDSWERRDRLAHCAQFLIDNQTKDGLWDAGRPVDPPDIGPPPMISKPPKQGTDLLRPTLREQLEIPKRRDGAEKGDSVNARWAALGLSACRKTGFFAPAAVMDKAMAAWRTGSLDPTDTITGLAVLLRSLRRNVSGDLDVRESAERLQKLPIPTEPRALYALKEATLIHYSRATLGGREWWQDSAKILVKGQASDGGWGSLEDTCAATRFLSYPHPASRK